MGQPSDRPQLALADSIYCFTAGGQVPVEQCATSCGAPELRPRCWAARGIARSFDAEPDPEDAQCPACLHRAHPNDVCEYDLGEHGECQCAWRPDLGGSE